MKLVKDLCHINLNVPAVNKLLIRSPTADSQRSINTTLRKKIIMPLLFEINNRIYDDLKDAKDFNQFLKASSITKGFIKPYLKKNTDDTNQLGNSWVDFIDLKDNANLGIFLLTHGGVDGQGRLGLIYEKRKNDDLVRKLIYWNTREEKLSKEDVILICS